MEGCYACRVGSIQLTPSAMPTRTVTKIEDYNFQQGFAREFENGDRESYKALRQQGYQPPRIAGSAELAARASSRYEIESGVIAADQRKLRDALQVADDGGFQPLAPSITPKAVD